MATTLRGQPQIAEVIAAIEAVWERTPDLEFATIVANACSSLGLVGERLGDALFMRRISDGDFLWGLHHWQWMARFDLGPTCPVCGLAWDIHEPPRRP